MLKNFRGQAQKEDDDTVLASYTDKVDYVDAAKAAEASSALDE